LSGETGQPSVVLVQTGIPEYRVNFIDALSQQVPGLRIAAGESLFQSSIPHDDRWGALTIKAVNHFGAKRRLLWQSRIMKPLLRSDVVVLSWNPRILSNWVVMLLRRFVGRPTLLWGHAWPRQGREARTVALRYAMTKFSSGVVTYTHDQAAEVRRKRPGMDVTVAPNAVLFAQRMTPALPGGDDFLFVGRLIEGKRPELVCRSFLAAHSQLGHSRLHIIGDGPLSSHLREAYRDPRIIFHGHIPMGDGVAHLASNCLASVVGGYVGLSAIDSLAFGVPVIFPDDEPHSPEIEALDSTNSLPYQARSTEALRDALVSVHRSKATWLARRPDISQVTASRYSVEAMAAGMARAVLEAHSRATGLRRTEEHLDREGRQSKEYRS
jgi:glycosyltransferase involved in cell wall biosynthesis